MSKNINNSIVAKQCREQENDKKKELLAKWRSRIERLSKEGYSAKEIYKACRIQIQTQLGFDPAKMIEHFTGESITKDEQGKAKTHCIDDDIEI